mgnify:CR=1 FL=1
MSKTVLLVEDNDFIRNMYQLKLSKAGINCVEAVDGAMCLAKINEAKPDLVLLDLMMPEMTGDEMLTQMRKEPWGKNIPVIVLTNLSENEALPKVRGQSIDGLLVKAQYTPKQVVTIVQKTLKP